MTLLLLLLLLLAGLAHAGGDALDDSDIVATRTVSASDEAIRAWLSDLHNHEKAWPAGCTKKWVYGEKTQGVGASAALVYSPASLRRKLTATLIQVDPPKRVELDHAGKKGFVTTWTMAPADAGTQVEMHTWIQGPPKPFRRTYANRVHPAWQWCEEGFLENMDKDLKSDG